MERKGGPKIREPGPRLTSVFTAEELFAITGSQTELITLALFFRVSGALLETVPEINRLKVLFTGNSGKSYVPVQLLLVELPAMLYFGFRMADGI